MGRKLRGGCASLGEGELAPRLTRCGQGRGLPGTCMPSFILIHRTVWPQCANVTGRTDRTDRQADRQWTDSIERTVLQRSPNHCIIISKPFVRTIYLLCVAFWRTRASILCTDCVKCESVDTDRNNQAYNCQVTCQGLAMGSSARISATPVKSSSGVAESARTSVTCDTILRLRSHKLRSRDLTRVTDECTITNDGLLQLFGRNVAPIKATKA